MKIKSKIKWLADLLMTILLLCLMAYQVTGDALHEWIGVTTLIVFIMHNVLNIKWYSTLFKGKYTVLRLVRTIVNLGVLASILCLGFSGIVMSRHVFAVLPINGSIVTARTMHLAASYWGFVLMSVHFGLHWSMIIGIFRKLTGARERPVLVRILRIVAFAVAGYGAYCFINADIFSYMFLKTEFVFFDFQKSAFSVFSEYIAMMELWVFVGYYVTKGLGELSALRSKRKENSHGKN